MEEPYVFSLYFRTVPPDMQVKAEPNMSCSPELQRKHELDLVRLRCEQEKGATRQIRIRSYIGTPQPLQAWQGKRDW